ncbi:MAG: nucleoside kinase [Bacteroidaceae bacterium]|jgi:uridine kinase|nr:nucleoside kinase [Bacteroidaceae bacterium]
MADTLRIRCKNNKKTKNVPLGSTLLDVYHAFNLDIPYGPCSAKVNNKIEGLGFPLYHNKDVEFLNITTASGMRTYARTLLFILCKAAKDLYPDVKIKARAVVSRGLYLSALRDGKNIHKEEVEKIKERMQEIIDADLPFYRHEIPTDEAIKMFEERGDISKVRLLESSGKLYTTYQELDGMPDYYYGSILPSTGQIHLFDLVKFSEGILLRIPSRKHPDTLEEMVEEPKLLSILLERFRLQDTFGITTVGDFNLACKMGHAVDLINIAEALQEKKIAAIADEITRRGNVKVVLIAGPSSSGKTTFGKRLSVQLLANGLYPYSISLDNYYAPRERVPKDENGNLDLESLYALDLNFFNEQVNQLLNGEEIELPKYNFNPEGHLPSGKKLRMTDNMILIMEGIHGLNPNLMPQVPAENTFKIFISALTTILLDDHNFIPPSDNRLLRRILRDSKYRNCPAKETIQRWPSVLAGEEKWIFPFQENADAMFNSALMFELAIIKDKILPVLEKVTERDPEYSEVVRLKKFLLYFNSVSDKEIPPTSLLREFMGGSSFEY